MRDFSLEAQGTFGLPDPATCSDEVVKAYEKAGRIAAQVREEARRRVREGMKLIEVCEWVERRIRELGGQPAFPCNISVNEVAAHYSPLPGDEAAIPPGSVVKLDIGVHVDGYIADTAVTLAFDDRYSALVEAVEEALERALALMRPNTELTAIGRAIESAIRSRGFKPVVNLSGHSLARYTVHAGDVIPNTGSRLVRGKIAPCKAYAVEPFATTGEGIVVEREPVTIYAYSGRPLRQRLAPDEKRVAITVVSRFRTLPFSPRWLLDVAGYSRLRQVLTRLAARGILISYPVLVERSGGVVAQAEHTVLVLKDEAIVVTG